MQRYEVINKGKGFGHLARTKEKAAMAVSGQIRVSQFE